ncbi:Pentulose kinase [Cantharellus anzutake]|uniref:Pentulose kinase n=1 Tax=Cantharellus anzutake TaxID=1750568 RepID=UPI001903F073|nr:Pentulose kinase [Cantharellus anzutake]KAF8319228.1 Pentulose kinase [Cantharellus anzutake]
MQSVSNESPDSHLHEKYYIGIDVGTGSARAALVNHTGKIVATRSEPTKTFRSATDSNIFEQSTPDIWRAISICTQDVLKQSGIKPNQVKGLGFDATCSLAVSDLQGEPITVTVGNELGKPGDRNVILWADHRAHAEAQLINSSGSDVLKYVGGTMSLEMEIPKTLWLKNNMPPERFSQCQFFDLPDFLTYKATSNHSRSSCSLVCKCSYVPPPAGKGWDDEFLTKIGLKELVDEGFLRLGGFPGKDGSAIMTAGLPVAKGLTKKAADELGLLEGTPVGSAVIDAYAGWIGTVAARYTTRKDAKELSAPVSLSDSRHRLAAVAGTSTCHVIHNPDGIFVPGVWGPYKNAVFPGWWMNEGGQSSTGQLIDFVITNHPAYPELVEISRKTGKNIHVILEEKLVELQREAAEKKAARLGKKVEEIDFGLTELTKDLHFYPDLHGNRSPLADPEMRGSIVGLTLDNSLNDLALKFNVALEAIALQTRHIVDEMNARGYDIKGIFMSGGQAANLALMNLFANVCKIPVILPHSYSAAVVIGSAMLGRYAAEVHEQIGGKVFFIQEEIERVSEENKERLWDIMVEMTQPGIQIVPGGTDREKRLLEAKYKIFREAIVIQRRWRMEMAEASSD